MTRDVDVDRYAAALDEHLRHDGGERSLLHAYELGRALMEAGAGILDVVRLHSLAVVARGRSADAAERRASHAFLAEVLAPFEMAYLGFADANRSLQRLTASLEEQVARRTSELEETLSELQASDAERRRLLARVTTAQEEERRRIADDLHDDSIQVMTAVSLRIATLRREVGAAQRRILDQLEGTVSDTIGRLRRLLFELRPPGLDQEGLGAAIRQYCTTALADSPHTWVREHLDRQPPVAVRETAYRVAQEALANVRKHARARRVDVRIERHGDGTLVTVTDDGVGFDPGVLGAHRPGHLGVTAMRERAALAGGWCAFDSAPGAGTTVTFWLPDHHEAV